MALTQNEQLIIKHVGENYLTKQAMVDICPAYALASEKALSSTWLSKKVNGDPLIPIEGRFYFVCNVGKIYQWSNLEKAYTQANLPDTLTAEETTEMWQEVTS